LLVCGIYLIGDYVLYADICHLDKINSDILNAQGEKETFAAGPQLNVEILQSESLGKGENSHKNKRVQEKEDYIQR
jgi:hypothetical protein